MTPWHRRVFEATWEVLSTQSRPILRSPIDPGFVNLPLERPKS